METAVYRIFHKDIMHSVESIEHIADFQELFMKDFRIDSYRQADGIMKAVRVTHLETGAYGEVTFPQKPKPGEVFKATHFLIRKCREIINERNQGKG